MGISYSAIVQLRLICLSMSDHRLMRYAESGSEGSSRGSSWRERQYKRNEDQRHEWYEERSSSGEGSSQTYQLSFEVPTQEQHDRRDQELEHLHRMVRDLELEVWGRCQSRDRDEFPERSKSVKGSHGEASHQFGSRRSRDRS